MNFDEQEALQGNFFGHQLEMQNNLFSHQNTQNFLRTTNDFELHNNTLMNQYNLQALNAGSKETIAQTRADAVIKAAEIGARGSVEAAALKATSSAANVMTSGLFGLASAGIGVGSSLLSGGLNYLYAKSLINEQATAQRTNFDYMTNKSESAFTSAGLPSWLAFTGGRGMQAFPNQSTNMGGQNFFSSALPGNTSSLAWTGSQSQLALGVGSMPSTTD